MFVHELFVHFSSFAGVSLSLIASGNLRVELDGTPFCDVNMEHSYLVHFHLFTRVIMTNLVQIDFSKELIAWVKSENFALVDVNLFPKPFSASALSTLLVQSITGWCPT